MAITLFYALLFLPLGLYAGSGDISGYWLHTEKKGTSVSKVYQEGNLYKAFCFMYTNTGVSQENDKGNPDKSKRGRSMKGVIFLYNLQPAEDKGETVWAGGRLYNPRDGNEYKAKAFLSDGGDTLNIRVSLDKLGALGVTLKWKRASSPSEIVFYEKEAAAIKPIYPLE